MKEQRGYIVILPEQIIEIPLSSNLSWLRMFYALPREPVYLELPRNIRRLLDSEKYRSMLKSDSFLELVWDCYAWAAWQFFQVPKKGCKYQDIPGDWQKYSGDFPLWRMAYLILPHFRNRIEASDGGSFQELFTEPTAHDIDWLTYEQFSVVVEGLTKITVEEENWQPLIDEIWKSRQPEDYAGKSVQKRDFMRSWMHSRTIPALSLEEIRANGLSINGDAFKSRLSETDQRILELRAAGYSQKEIAERVGFKVPSAVSKRIRQVANRFDDFVSKEYGEFIDKHIE